MDMFKSLNEILATREDEEIFVNSLLHPKEPNEVLKKAFNKYKSQSKKFDL